MKIFKKKQTRRRALVPVVTPIAPPASAPSTPASAPSTPAPAPSTPAPAPKAFNFEGNVIRALGKIDMKNQKIVSLNNPTEAGDAVNLIYLQSFVNDRYMRKDDAQNIVVKRVGSPIDKTDAANKAYVDNAVAAVSKLQDKSVKFICIPSTDKNVSGTIILRDVKLLHAVLQLPNPDKSKVFIIISERGKLDKKELKNNKSIEYEINQILDTYTNIYFEVQPPMALLPSITLYYVDNTFDNKLTG